MKVLLDAKIEALQWQASSYQKRYAKLASLAVEDSKRFADDAATATCETVATLPTTNWAQVQYRSMEDLVVEMQKVGTQLTLLKQLRQELSGCYADEGDGESLTIEDVILTLKAGAASNEVALNRLAPLKKNEVQREAVAAQSRTIHYVIGLLRRVKAN
jgi:hypothetical protein